MKERRQVPIRLVDVRKGARKLKLAAYGSCSCHLVAGFRHVVKMCVQLAQDTERRRGAPPTRPTTLVMYDETLSLQTAFLQELVPAPEEDTSANNVKILVLGHQAAGKTSLLRSLGHEKQRGHIQSTIGIEQIQCDMVDGANVVAFDFAVDGSKEHPTPTNHLMHWMQLLSAHAKGPRATCKLLVVLTKVDKIVKHCSTKGDSARLLRVREDQLRREASAWPFVQEMEWDLISISSKTGENLDELKRVVRSYIKGLSSQKIPRVTVKLGKELRAMARTDGGMFITLGELKSHLPEKLSRELQRCLFLEESLEILHNVGVILLDMGDYQCDGESREPIVCLKPFILANALSLFFAPPHHLNLLTSGTEFTHANFRDEISLKCDYATKGREEPCFCPSPTDRRCVCMEDCITCKAWESHSILKYARAASDGSCQILLASGDRVSTKRCACFKTVTTGPKFLAACVTGMPGSEYRLTAGVFTKLLTKLHEQLDQRFKVFNNAAFLRDDLNNLAMVTLNQTWGDVPGEMAVHELQINVAVRGIAPELWNLTFKDIASVGSVEPLCPICVQSDLFSSLFLLETGHLQCQYGHELTRKLADKGVPEDSSVSMRKSLWAPKSGSRFYQETEEQKMWTRCEECERAAGINAGTGALFTVLSEKERSPARMAEYVNARNIFYGFLGKDRKKNFELQYVTFVHNPQLEEAFSATFSEMAKRALSVEKSSVPEWEEPSGDLQKKRRQRWINDYLQKSLERSSSSTSLVNMILGWHGTIEKYCHQISHTNFRMPAPLVDTSQTGWRQTLQKVLLNPNPPKDRQDPGYFGNGVYFTQSPSYGAEYALTIAKNKKRDILAAGRADEHGISECLLASWILLGRVYPVTEAANAFDPASMLGAPLREGYDSHFTVLPNKNRVVQDEIVVFSKSQILPRYIFHFREKAQCTAIPDMDLQDFKAEVRLIVAEISRTQSIVVKAVTSSEEMRVWLQNYGDDVSRKLRIVTNSCRPDDGGDGAAERVVHITRDELKLDLPILIYNRTTEKEEQLMLLRRLRSVYVTTDPLQLLGFCLEGKLKRKPS
eukprot:m51a1_g10957 hypothetical protein (1066) ;mRNA; r:208994-212991